MNKCANSDCNNHVVDDKFELCPACFKAEKAQVKRHKCASPDCSHMIPEQYEFCVPCRKDRESGASAQKLELRKLRCSLIGEYKSDALRDGATVVHEVQFGKIVIAFDGKQHTFQDMGCVAARQLVRERKAEALQRMQEAEAMAKKLEAARKLEAEAAFRMSLINGLETSLSDSRVLTGLPTLEAATLFPQDAKENRKTLFSCMEEHLPEGIKIKSLKGAQVILAKGDRSYTVYCEALGDAFKKIDQAAADRKRQAAAEAQRKAEEAERIRKETERALFVQYKKGELDIVHEDREGVRITLLLADERTVSFDDLDELEARAQKARDAKAAADAKERADRKANKKGKSQGKDGKKGGKDQRKAA